MILSAVAIIVVPLEINQGISRFIPEFSDKKELNIFITTSFWFTFFTTSCFFILTIIFANYLSVVFLGTSKLLDIFIIGIVVITTRIYFNFFQNILRYQLKARIYVVSSCIFSFSSALLSLILLIKFKLGVVSIFYGQIFGYLIGFSFSFFWTKVNLFTNVDFQKLKMVLKFSIPLLFSSISILVAQYIDRFMIKSMINLQSVGYYGIGFRIASVTSIIIIGLQNSLTPLIYNNYKKEETPGHISKIFNYYIILALIILLFFSAFSFEFIKLFTSIKYLNSIPVIPFLILSMLIANMYIFTPGIFIEKKTKMIALINIVIAIENLLLNMVFIPLIGIIGASIATGISSLTSFILYFNLGQKYYPIQFEWRKIFVATILIFSVINLIINLPLNQIQFLAIKICFVLITAIMTLFIIDKTLVYKLYSTIILKK